MRRRSLVLQAGVAAGLIALLALLVNTLTVNLLVTGSVLTSPGLADPPASLWPKVHCRSNRPTAISGRSPLAGSTASRSSGLVW